MKSSTLTLILIFLLDVATGETSEQSVEISPTEKVGSIRELLGLEQSCSLTWFNLGRQVGAEDPVGAVFEADDTVTLVKEEAGGEERKAERNITNESDDEIILVLLNSKKSGPVFVPGGAVKNIRLGRSLWSDNLELYRCSIGTPTSLRSFGEKFQESQR